MDGFECQNLDHPKFHVVLVIVKMALGFKFRRIFRTPLWVTSSSTMKGGCWKAWTAKSKAIAAKVFLKSLRLGGKNTPAKQLGFLSKHCKFTQDWLFWNWCRIGDSMILLVANDKKKLKKHFCSYILSFLHIYRFHPLDVSNINDRNLSMSIWFQASKMYKTSKVQQIPRIFMPLTSLNALSSKLTTREEMHVTKALCRRHCCELAATEIILPETHIAPEKWWFAIGIRYVSLQECKHFQLSNGFDSWRLRHVHIILLWWFCLRARGLVVSRIIHKPN